MNIDVCGGGANEEVRIVRLSGRLVEALKPKMLAAVAESKAGVIFDLDKVDFISSAGLRVILAARQEAESGGKPLALVGARPSIYKIFKIAVLDKVFQFFGDEADALQALSA